MAKMESLCTCLAGGTPGVKPDGMLLKLLPDATDYVICSYQWHEEQIDSRPMFRATLRLPYTTVTEVKEWLTRFQELTLTTLRISKTHNKVGKYLVYKGIYRCHHNTRQPKAKVTVKASSKNTNCPAQVTVAVKRTTGFVKKKQQSKDVHLPSHPTKITIKFLHNHPLETADVLKRRDVAPEVRAKFIKLYQSGHTPTSAIKVHKYDLEEGIGLHGYHGIKIEDRRVCPDTQWCFRLYYKLFPKEDRIKSGELSYTDVESRISALNSQFREVCVKADRVDGEIVVALCSPLMQRVHEQIVQSGDIVFVDETRYGDKLHLFVSLNKCSAGGLPLGIVITSSGSEKSISAGFELLKTLLPTSAFGGRGVVAGPAVIMTDDASGVRSALATVFPNSVVLINEFHILLSVWTWVWNSKNQIARQDRSVLYYLVKDLVYAPTLYDLNVTFDNLTANSTAMRYNNFLQYVTHLFSRSQLWSSAFRQNINVHGLTTSEIVQSSMKALKDKVFLRMKSFNVIQLIDFLITRLEFYYEHRLVCIASNKVEVLNQLRGFPKEVEMMMSIVSQTSADEYSVSNQGNSSTACVVNTALGVCTCSTGSGGAPCKHQWVVLTKCNMTCYSFMPEESQEMQKVYREVAGSHEQSCEEWLTMPVDILLQDDSGNDTVAEKSEICESSTPVGARHSPTSHGYHPQDHFMAPLGHESPAPSESSTSAVLKKDEDLETLKSELKSFGSAMCANLDSDLKAFQGPVSSFLQNYRDLVSQEDLIAALEQFGDESEIAYALEEMKRNPQQQLSPSIGQSTSGRGQGKRRGRPPKSQRSIDMVSEGERKVQDEMAPCEPREHLPTPLPLGGYPPQYIPVHAPGHNEVVHATGQNVAMHATGQNIAICATGQNVAIHATGQNVAIHATGQNLSVHSSGQNAAVHTTADNVTEHSYVHDMTGHPYGPNPGIHTSGHNAVMYTAGQNTTIYTMGHNTIHTTGPSTVHTTSQEPMHTIGQNVRPVSVLHFEDLMSRYTR
ncbi:uncharacterized protein LOC143026316 isoform X2 [Oratosquilla oratoria]